MCHLQNRSPAPSASSTLGHCSLDRPPAHALLIQADASALEGALARCGPAGPLPRILWSGLTSDFFATGFGHGLPLAAAAAFVVAVFGAMFLGARSLGARKLGKLLESSKWLEPAQSCTSISREQGLCF